MQLYRRGIHMKNKMNINTFIAEYAIIIIFIVLFVAMSIFAPNFLTGSNIANVLRQVSINGICAIGMTFMYLYRVCNRSCYQPHRNTAHGRNHGNHDVPARCGVPDYRGDSGIRI